MLHKVSLFASLTYDVTELLKMLWAFLGPYSGKKYLLSTYYVPDDSKCWRFHGKK